MTLVLSDYILECVLVRNGRCLSLVEKKNKSGVISTFIQSISLSRGISYLGSIGSRHSISSFIDKMRLTYTSRGFEGYR